MRLELLANNALNHPNYMDANTNITNLGTAGVITATMDETPSSIRPFRANCRCNCAMEW